MTFDALINMALIVLGFGLLIGIHELGHFIAAKWSGIRTNAFAIGMGPQVISFRKGVGFCYKSTKAKVIAKCGKSADDMSDEELKKFGVSETEYSLRLLPIGGFVSMLGQEDGKPDVVSDDPRSYNSCSIGKRMIVVSAGVIMNLLLAGVFFLICFQIGVNFEAPIIGHVIPDSPAAKATALTDGITPLQTGDTVVSIDGKEAKTFTDIQIAGAMAKPGVPVQLEVKRQGIPELLTYSITPGSVTQNGLLEFGLYPASSLILRSGEESSDSFSLVAEQFDELRGLHTGMKMVSACLETEYQKNKDAFINLSQWEDFKQVVATSDGIPILTKWSRGNNSQGIDSQLVTLAVMPELNILRPVGISTDAPQNFEFGYMGLVPLSKVNYVLQSSPNSSVLQKGDVITRVASIEAPRMGQLRNFLTSHPDGDISLTVLRSGEEVELKARIDSGKLGVLLTNAIDVPIIAQPLQEILIEIDGELTPAKTAIAGKQLLGGSRFVSLNNWLQLRELLEGSEHVSIKLMNPTKNAEIVTIQINSTKEQRKKIASSGWTTPLVQQLFEPLYITRSSGGNPVKALQMGFDETINMVVMTYLTIDRLFRRSVGVEQLRGPIGIIHIGSKIADRGLSYLLFFLAIISVNLAVLNFLPLPIVDGGLFLYLIYEKIFKKPPSIAFQNAAAILGLSLIATLFIVTFYNDIARLV